MFHSITSVEVNYYVRCDLSTLYWSFCALSINNLPQ